MQKWIVLLLLCAIGCTMVLGLWTGLGPECCYVSAAESETEVNLFSVLQRNGTML